MPTPNPKMTNQQLSSGIATGTSVLSGLASGFFPATYNRQVGMEKPNALQNFTNLQMTSLGASLGGPVGAGIGFGVDLAKNAIAHSRQMSAYNQAVNKQNFMSGRENRLMNLQPDYTGYARKGIQSPFGQQKTPVEIERNEIVVLPTETGYQEYMQTSPDDPTHEQGGVKTMLPQGALVFPKKYINQVKEALGQGDTQTIDVLKEQMLKESNAAAQRGEPFSGGNYANNGMQVDQDPYPLMPVGPLVDPKKEIDKRQKEIDQANYKEYTELMRMVHETDMRDKDAVFHTMRKIHEADEAVMGSHEAKNDIFRAMAASRGHFGGDSKRFNEFFDETKRNFEHRYKKFQKSNQEYAKEADKSAKRSQKERAAFEKSNQEYAKIADDRVGRVSWKDEMADHMADRKRSREEHHAYLKMVEEEKQEKNKDWMGLDIEPARPAPKPSNGKPAPMTDEEMAAITKGHLDGVKRRRSYIEQKKAEAQQQAQAQAEQQQAQQQQPQQQQRKYYRGQYTSRPQQPPSQPPQPKKEQSTASVFKRSPFERITDASSSAPVKYQTDEEMQQQRDKDLAEQYPKSKLTELVRVKDKDGIETFSEHPTKMAEQLNRLSNSKGLIGDVLEASRIKTPMITHDALIKAKYATDGKKMSYLEQYKQYLSYVQQVGSTERMLTFQEFQKKLFHPKSTPTERAVDLIKNLRS